MRKDISNMIENGGDSNYHSLVNTTGNVFRKEIAISQVNIQAGKLQITRVTDSQTFYA